MEALNRPGHVSMEPFERAAGAGAQLLRVDRLAVRAGGDPTRSVSFLLTFDVGRILVSAEPGAGLVAFPLPDPEALPSGLVDASEEEPWWRFLGCPLLRARSEAADRAVALQFRISGGGLRTLSLALEGSQIHASLAHDA